MLETILNTDTTTYENDPIARAAFDTGGLSVTPIRRSKRVETGRVAAIVTDSRAFCRPHDDDDMRAKKRRENPHASIARIVASTRDVDIRRRIRARSRSRHPPAARTRSLGTHPDARARPVLRSSTRAQSGSTPCASCGNVWTLGSVGVLGAGASVEKTYVFASHDTHARVRVTIDVIATGHWTSNARFTATRWCTRPMQSVSASRPYQPRFVRAHHTLRASRSSWIIRPRCFTS